MAEDRHTNTIPTTVFYVFNFSQPHKSKHTALQWHYEDMKPMLATRYPIVSDKEVQPQPVKIHN